MLVVLGCCSAPPPPPLNFDTTLRVSENKVARPNCIVPGAVVSAIINPVYGNLQAGCNSTRSYR